MNDNLTILVLTGGYSRRFDDEKAFMQIEGRTLIERVVERVENGVQELIISYKCGGDRLKDMFPDALLLRDKHKEEGPLVGLLSALPYVKSRFVAVLPCDHPFVEPQVLDLLKDRAQGHDAAIPRWPNGYLEPLVAVYDAEKLKWAVQKVWGRGMMKLSMVIDELNDVVFVPTEEIRKVDLDLKSFVNINSPEDLEKLAL